MGSRVVYLIHFERKYRHCLHYIGCTIDLEWRMRLHRTSKRKGAKLLRALIVNGIGFEVVRTWDGGYELEKKLKSWKKSSLLCPVCISQSKTKGDNNEK